MITNTKTTTITSSIGTAMVSGTDTETGNNEQAINEVLAPGTTNQQITMQVILANLQSIFLLCSNPCLINTNGTAGSDVQTISITGSPAGGEFTLAFEGQPTYPLLYNSSAVDVQTALRALPAIGPGNVVCGGGALPGTPITCTFAGLLANGFQPQIAANSDGLTGGSSPTVHIAHITPGLPSNSILLSAGVPYSWGVSENYEPLVLTENIETAYVSCTAGGTLQGRILQT